jgi:hypothetical protein
MIALPSHPAWHPRSPSGSRARLAAALAASLAALITAVAAEGSAKLVSSASTLVGAEVTVDCVDLSALGWWGAAEVGGSRMELDREICAVLTASPRLRRGVGTHPSSGAAVLTLAHEAGHLTGIEDERKADCFAETNLRRAAVALGYLSAQFPRLQRQARAVSEC